MLFIFITINISEMVPLSINEFDRMFFFSLVLFLHLSRKPATQHIHSTWMKTRHHFKAKIRTSVSTPTIELHHFVLNLMNVFNHIVPDTTTAAIKTARDLKESATVAPAPPTTNDSKLPPSPAQINAESKPLQRVNSTESSEKEGENDRRAPVVSVHTLKFDYSFRFGELTTNQFHFLIKRL